MASYLPPTENLPIFDTQVFDTANNSYLTYSEAKKYFITFPIAQGTATITDLIAGGISYLTPASGSFFDIGANQVSGGTIRVGPTGGSSGVSVHCGNIDFKNNTINNATSGTTGNINLGDVQTTGVLNIGTGIRTTTGNGGAININTTDNASNNAPMNIGGVNSAAVTTSATSRSNVSLNGQRLWSNWISEASIRTGGSLTLTSSNSAAVNIATESFSNIIMGASGTTKTLTIYNALATPLFLPTTSVTPATTQLGYYTSFELAHTSVGTSITNLVTTGASIGIGRYMVVLTMMADTFSTSTSTITLSIVTTNGTTDILLGAMGASSATGGYISNSITGYTSITTTSGTLQVRGISSVGTISVKTNIKFFRIA